MNTADSVINLWTVDMKDKNRESWLWKALKILDLALQRLMCHGISGIKICVFFGIAFQKYDEVCGAKKKKQQLQQQQQQAQQQCSYDQAWSMKHVCVCVL